MVQNKIIKHLSKKQKTPPFTPTNPKLKRNIEEPLVITDVWGMRFLQYVTDSETIEVIVSKDFYKPEILAMRRLVKKGDVVIDLGANIGLFSVLLSKEVGDKGHVHAFEPVQDTYWRMRENLALNRCLNVTTYQQAASNKRGKATMNIFPVGYGAWNTFGKPVFGEIKSVPTEKVPIITMDSFAKSNNLKRIDFLKIDVEGYERDVLEGTATLLSKNKVKYISFEISEIPLKGAGREASEIFDLLHSYGYKVYEFDESSNKFKGPVTETTTFYQNFYASKSDLRKL